jgi:glutaredoxin
MNGQGTQGFGLLNRTVRSRLGATVAIGLLLVGSSCASRRTSVKADWATATPATPATLALVAHLNQQEAKLYTTYWCPYCQRQQLLFGSAVANLKVVECDPNGENARPEECSQAQVSSYPTWQINGKLYRGLRSREDLALISGYPGSQQFEK